MNAFDDLQIDYTSFAYRDLLSQDLWQSFTVSASITVVGTATYTGRYRMVGRQCFFQISAVSTVSVATTAGTSYFALPVTAGGLGGVATMTNDTTDIAVGVCHIDVTNSRVYPPTQAASANTFIVSGWFETG